MKKMLMLAGLLFTACAALAGPRLRYTINEHWKFFKGECPGAEEPGIRCLPLGNGRSASYMERGRRRGRAVRLVPGAGWYVRDLPIDSLAGDRRIFLSFGAANTVASVWVNGPVARASRI